MFSSAHHSQIPAWCRYTVRLTCRHRVHAVNVCATGELEDEEDASPEVPSFLRLRFRGTRLGGGIFELLAMAAMTLFRLRIRTQSQWLLYHMSRLLHGCLVAAVVKCR